MTTLYYESNLQSTGPNANHYTYGFTGTSAAAPMVAGTVASVQSYVKNTSPFNCTLKPYNIRHLLKDTGVCQGRTDGSCPSITDKIGPLPDIQAAITRINQLTGDCDQDGLKDACEYADCNNNGVQDVCDIYSNPTQYPDCDNDGIPNSCEQDRDCDGTPDDCDSTPAPSRCCCDYLNVSPSINVNSTQCECTAGSGDYYLTGKKCDVVESTLGACCRASGSCLSNVNECVCNSAPAVIFLPGQT